MITADYVNKLVLATVSITDMVAFHNTLRSIEDDPEGMLYPTIHTYKEVSLGSGAVFPAIEFINGWQLKFPFAGNYTISGGNLNMVIVPVAGVYVHQTQAAAYAVTTSGGSGIPSGDITSIVNGVWNHTSATNLLAEVDLIKEYESGRWKIVNNQMIFYKADNITELARYDLKDSSGNATMSSPMERIKV